MEASDQAPPNIDVAMPTRRNTNAARYDLSFGTHDE
jgi:hypothetical protein